MYELYREILSKLNNIINKLEVISRENSIYIDAYNELSELYSELSKLKTPLIYTREWIEKHADLYFKLENTSRVLDKYREFISEEITVQLNDLINSLDKYISVLKNTYRRERILFTLPIFSVLFIFIWSIFIYISVNTDLARLLVIPLTIVFVSLYLNNKGYLTTSYVLLSITAASGIVLVALYSGRSTFDQYNILLYFLILLTSISYMHTSRLLKSRVNQERIINFMNNLLKIISTRRESGEDVVLKTRELEEKAIEIYKKLYGSDGEKLFRYKLNVLIMHGYKREEALKKITPQLSSETS